MTATHKILDVLRLAVRSLRAHLVRSILTSLGIIFGVCGVIAMLGITEGASYQSQLYLRELGSDKIIIRSVNPPEEDKASESRRGPNVYGLNADDVARLQSNIPDVVRCVTLHQSKKYLSFGTKRQTVSVFGTGPELGLVARIRMAAGRFLTVSDMVIEPVPKAACVMPASLARRVFGYLDPIGQTVLIGAEPFHLVGILAQVPQAVEAGMGGRDECVFVPDTVRKRRLGKFTLLRAKGGFQFERVDVSQIILQMKDEEAVSVGAGIARSLLSRTHDKADYLVKVPMELLAQKRKQTRLWAIVLLVIAGISLVVGGIGIMNIMLASVTERTREIGVRRALGAKQADIAVQFLVESVALTIVGGLLGIAVGLLGPWAVDRAGVLPFETIITPWAIVVPFLRAVAVGLVSGLYPALRAAKLDPIEALRHE